VSYLERDGALLAYQVVGDAGADVLFIGEAASHFDLCWTDPHLHALYERGATFARTAYMQLRGLGLSEPIRYYPTLEQQADDVLAVLDAAGMQRATFVGSLTTCGAVVVAAAKAPERVTSLVLLKGIACGPLADDAMKNGWTPDEAQRYAEGYRAVMSKWGSGSSVEMWDPVLATPYNRRMMALLERCSATPAFAQTYVEAALAVDLTPYLPAIQAPVRVLYSPTAPEPEAVLRRTVELLPNGTFHRLQPMSPGSSVGESFVQIGDHIEEAATGIPHQPDADRFLGTVLFTDLVASTELLARIGDAEYRDLRAAHERQVRFLVEESGGSLIHVTGDGTLSLFAGPTRAVRCAHDICRSATGLGLRVRTGVHTGELERVPGDVSGLSVHIGARIASLAEPDEVLVSSTVRDLVAGSGLAFTDRGQHRLRGVPGEWNLVALTGVHERPALDGRHRTRLLDRAALRTARTAPGATRAAVRLGNAMQRYRARMRPRDLAQ
jgi:class 3 adenylate cyclase/pimeloyl-ACP methyl ester carboxylesterase